MSELKKSYNDLLDRWGYFCDVCGHEANTSDGIIYFKDREGRELLVCRNECLDERFNDE